MRSIILLLSVFSFTIFFYSCNSQASANEDFGVAAHEITPEGLNWYTMEDLEKMKNVKGKKVLVDMYTSWCGWCKVMDKKTFTDPKIIEHLNKNFVLVKFNAEQKEPITFKGRTYEWIGGGRKGVNTLAVKLMSGRLSYPTLVYLDDNFEVITASPGYKTPEQLIGELEIL